MEAPVYDEFVSLVTKKVGELRQGAPRGPGSVDLGAVIHPPQSDIVEAHVRDAVDKGARVVAGGHRSDADGHFYEPTVLLDVDHSMDGHARGDVRADAADHEGRRRRGGRAPLQRQPVRAAASVWTKDVAKGERLARRIEAGAVTVNDAQINYVALELPMGGWKSSGLGSRHGADGIRKYTKKQAIVVTRLAPKRDLHMLPYSAKRTKLIARMLKLVYGRGKRD